MQELDRNVPAGGFPKPRRKFEDPTLADQRMRTVWVVYAGPTLQRATQLVAFITRLHVSVRTIRRVRRQYRVPDNYVTRLVQLPLAEAQAQQRLAARRSR